MFSSSKLSLTALAAVSFALAVNANYTLVDSFQGSTFFDDFDFFTETDPTRGFVDYVDFHSAVNSELIGLVNGSDSVYLGVDFQQTTSIGRQSVRVQSRQAWTHGLLIADVASMPAGCGTWPALWMLSHSAVWPGNSSNIGGYGEIDIIEGVNNQLSNAMTLHTSSGCTLTNDSSLYTGTMATSNCDVKAPNQADNAGCSIVAPVNSTFTQGNQSCTHSTYGTEFNKQGGGVYAMVWTSESLSFYFYPRDYIPTDISAGHPDPSSWSQQPLARLQGCDFDQHLSNLSIIINISLCGQFAGSLYATDGCAAETGTSTCDSYVGENPGAFSEAYWLFNSIKMYQNGTDARNSSLTKRSGQISERSLLVPTINLGERAALSL